MTTLDGQGLGFWRIVKKVRNRAETDGMLDILVVPTLTTREEKPGINGQETRHRKHLAPMTNSETGGRREDSLRNMT